MRTKPLLILDNIRSAFNVGSLFRTSDAIQAELALIGITPHPPHPKIEKTALGSHKSVTWRYHQNLSDLLPKLKSSGYTIAALEITPQAQSLYQYQPPDKFALILGNELDGVSDYGLDQSDLILKIPMKGVKSSLNVAIAGSIALYLLDCGQT